MELSRMKRSEVRHDRSLVRLQKIIAAAGLGSRRQAEEWIREGRITLNGRVVRELGTKARPGTDTIRVDGKKLERAEAPVAILLNKPRGYLSTCSDPGERPTVLDLVPGRKERLYPVGRLDFNSEGLLILTNDGELALSVTHPRNQCRKVYRVKVRGIPPEEILARLRAGIVLDGKRTSPATIRRVHAEKNAWLEIVLTEGRKNQIRQMFLRAGFPVVRLKRISIGGIGDRGLAPGSWRLLTRQEVRSLKERSA
jgi:23S rRNA pseudouridine2605 synthase